MKFTDALVHFCLLAIGVALIGAFYSTPSVQIFDRIFWLGMGLFSCWRQTQPQSSFLGRICRFFKAIPRCWAESKEATK